MAQEGRRHGVGRRAPARGVHRQGRHRAACPSSGTLLEIRVLEDETAEVGQTLGIIGTPAPAGAPAPTPAPEPVVAATPEPVAAPARLRPRTGPPVRSRCRGTRQRRRPERRCPRQRRTLRPLRDPAGPQARGPVGCGPVDRPGNGRRRPHHQAGHLRREEPPSRFGTGGCSRCAVDGSGGGCAGDVSPRSGTCGPAGCGGPRGRRPPLHRPLRHPPPSPPGRAPRR